MRAIALLVVSFLLLAAFHVSYSIVDANQAVQKQKVTDDSVEEETTENVVQELAVKNHRKKDLMHQTMQALAQRSEDALSDHDSDNNGLDNNGVFTNVTTVSPNTTLPEVPIKVKGKGRKGKKKGKKVTKVTKAKQGKKNQEKEKQNHPKKGKKQKGVKNGKGKGKKVKTTAVPQNETEPELEQTTEQPTSEPEQKNNKTNLLDRMIGDAAPVPRKNRNRHGERRHGGGSRRMSCQTDADCSGGCCVQKGERKFCKHAQRHGEGRKCLNKCRCMAGLECYVTTLNRHGRPRRPGKKIVGTCHSPNKSDLEKGYYMTPPPPTATTPA